MPESDGRTPDYIRRRDANRALWAARAARHGGELATTSSTAWVRAGTLRRLRRLIRPRDRVLEVGCGNGNLLGALAAGCRATGADLTMEMLQLARSTQPHLRDLARTDATWLPFRDGCFDLVYTSRVLINVQERAMQRAAIHELLRVVNAGGTVVLSENFEEPVAHLNRLKARYGAGAPEIDAHNLRLNLADTLRLCAHAGWVAIRIDGYPLASFVAHMVTGRLTQRRGGGLALRLLAPMLALLARCDDLASRRLPPFGKDTMIVFKQTGELVRTVDVHA